MSIGTFICSFHIVADIILLTDAYHQHREIIALILYIICWNFMKIGFTRVHLVFETQNVAHM
jgi:hypothetical protein